MHPRDRLLVAALAGFSSAASAQVPAGGEFPVATRSEPELASYGRSMATLPSGDFVIVWQRSYFAPLGAEVVGQRFDRSGTRVGAEFRVNTYTYGTQGGPRISALSRGQGFVVVWTSYNQGDTSSGVFGQVYDADGQRRHAEFHVNTHTPLQQRAFAVAPRTNGDFVVVWQSLLQDGSDYGVYARYVDRAGHPLGAEFRVNAFTTGHQSLPNVASRDDGSFLVVWTSFLQDGSADGVFGRWYDPGGNSVGGEFRVNDFTTGYQDVPTAAFDAAGNAVVTWQSQLQDGDQYGAFARRYNAGGAPIGGEFQVNAAATGSQEAPIVGMDPLGNFVIGYQNWSPAPFVSEIRARRFSPDSQPIGNDFTVNTTTSAIGGPTDLAVAVDAVGNFVVDFDLISSGSNWNIFGQRFGGLFPAALRVDTAGNGVLEPGETAVPVRPSWANHNGAAQAFTGKIENPAGPAGGAPTIASPQATYGTVQDGVIAECTSCYAIALPAPVPRPVVHWDTTVDERILPMTLGQHKRWTLHVGDSFTDVPRASGFYRFIETLLHRGVTGGCSATTYCPASSTAREQMAVFVLVAKEGAGYVPPACGTPVFNDVPASSPFCPWIEELARRGVVGGCGSGSYCPQASVTREQMAVFVLRVLDPNLTPPACGTPMFNDVPASSPFCRWIEELARRGVVSGCGGGNYCPAAAVSREQMGVFLSVTFGLTLYGV